MEQLLYVETASKIEKEIESQVYKIGDKLPSERELTSRYQVSRNVVRQAMTILREKGMITVHPGRGAYVTNPKDRIFTDTLNRLVHKYNSSFEDILEVRLELETSIMHYAINRATDQDIDRLRQIYQEMEIKKRSVQFYSQEDLNFHLELANATQNKIFPLLARSFYDLTERTFFNISDFTNKSMDTINKAQEHHGLIITAIEKRDQDMGKEVIRRHLELFQQEIQLLKEEGYI